MPTVLVTFVQATYVWRHLSISAISQRLLVRLWANFLEPIFWGSWFLWTKMSMNQISVDPYFFRTPHFWTSNFIGPKKNFKPKFFFKAETFYKPKFFFQTQNFLWTQHFYKELFGLKSYLGPLFLWNQQFLNLNFFVDL